MAYPSHVGGHCKRPIELQLTSDDLASRITHNAIHNVSL